LPKLQLFLQCSNISHQNCVHLSKHNTKTPERTIEYTCRSTHIYIPNYTQGDSAEMLSILGGNSGGNCEKKCSYEHMCNMYQFRLDNGDSQPWPWETPRERKKLSQRLDSLEHDLVLIVQHKRTFHYTTLAQTRATRGTRVLMLFAVRRVRFYRNTSSHTFHYKSVRHSKPG